MKRSLLTCTAALAATALVVSAAGPAAADSSLGTSYAAAAKVSPGGGLSPTISTSGAIGALLDFLTPVLNDVVTPLTTALTSLPSTLIADVAAGLDGSGYVANSPDTAQSPPGSGFPTCGSTGWTGGDCFGPLLPAVSAAPLISVGTGTVQGYGAADATGAYGAAQTSNVAVSLLGISLGSLGVAGSTSQCLANRVCSSTGTLTGLSLLSGAVAAKITGGALQVSLNGGAYKSLGSITSPVTLSAAGITATAQTVNGMLQLNVGLSLDSLLTALGIADVLSSLGASDNGSTITLTVNLGAGTSTSTDTTSGWGLEVGLGLSANVSISVLGLIGITVAAPDTTTTGDLMDMQLAYSAATNADVSAAGAPPALT
jgi:hypothetical protein